MNGQRRRRQVAGRTQASLGLRAPRRPRSAVVRFLSWPGWPKLVAAMPAVAAVAALAFTAQSLAATRDQLVLSQQGQALTEQGQVTDRFGKAVEQLGTKEVPTQLGGIYALERLTIDSPRDYSTIIEVLAAYIRQRSPLATCSTQASVPTEIQAALTVIGRRSKPNGIHEPIVDLRATCLKGAVFSGGWVGLDSPNETESTKRSGRIGNFRQVDLSESDLSRADLTNSNFFGANLARAQLIGVKAGLGVFSGASIGNIVTDLSIDYLRGCVKISGEINKPTLKFEC